MDLQSVVNMGLGLILTMLGWFAKAMWDAVSELKADLAQLRAELPKEYVAKDDYKADMKEIKDMLGKIFDRLDDKADKP